MALFRRAADRIIDRAHNAIANAEARLIHSFTDADIAAAGDEIAQAQRFLSRATAARDAWDAAEHGDYDEYPTVPETDMEKVAK